MFKVSRFSWYCFAPAALLLAACGSGGSGDDEGDDPGLVPDGTQLGFTAPDADADVRELGSTIPLAVSVRSNDGPAADGVAVSLSATAGHLSDSAPTTRSGSANSTITSSVAGKIDITANATVSGQAGSASTSVYFIPQRQAQRILVPAYFYPEAGSPWESLISVTASHPQVGITAIFNPNDGIFTSVDADEQAAARRFTAAGGELIGYIYTKWGSGERSLASIKSNVDAYLRLYGDLPLKGFFLDEMSTEPSALSFYKLIYDYIKAKNPALQVFGNPGEIPDAGYADVTDVLMTYEDYGSGYVNYDPRKSGGWLYARSNMASATIAHDVATCADMQAQLRRSRTERYNTGWVFFTDDSIDVPSRGNGNPYDSLPTYWSRFVDSLAALEAGQALPGC